MRWWPFVVALLLALAGCQTLELEKSISMETVYPPSGQTQVTIHYTVPPPPRGKMYVLWILNPAQHDVVNAGQVSGGSDVTARATVSFEATGAIVSIEDQANPSKMSNTWALKVGSVTPETPTPSVGGSSGSTTPSAAGTPTLATPSATAP
ncbi:MAG: anti-sigma factor domain-containing protein [Chloroflexota bacterium]